MSDQDDASELAFECHHKDSPFLRMDRPTTPRALFHELRNDTPDGKLLCITASLVDSIMAVNDIAQDEKLAVFARLANARDCPLILEMAKSSASVLAMVRRVDALERNSVALGTRLEALERSAAAIEERRGAPQQQRATDAKHDTKN